MNKAPAAALFLDFDNVFSSLFQRRTDSAEEFVRNPLAWVRWLEAGATDLQTTKATPRRILVRRCYLNPTATINIGNKKIQYSSFRRAFVRAGFQVIDCPPLTSAGKSSADMVMAMDILDAINHATRFEEFIIISSDADFTPILLRIRAHDRIGTIIALGNSADAYLAAADNVIRFDQFVPSGLQIPSERTRVAIRPDGRDIRDRLSATAVDIVRDAGGRMNMAKLGEELIRNFGRDTIEACRWGGEGTLGGLVEVAGLRRNGNYVSLPGNDEPPAVPASVSVDSTPGVEPWTVKIEGFVKSVNWFPKLTKPALASVFEALAETGTHAEDWMQQDYRASIVARASASGHPITIGAVGIVVRRVQWGGLVDRNADTPIGVQALRAAFLASIADSVSKQLPGFGDSDREALAWWVGIDDGEPAPEPEGSEDATDQPVDASSVRLPDFEAGDGFEEPLTDIGFLNASQSDAPPPSDQEVPRRLGPTAS